MVSLNISAIAKKAVDDIKERRQKNFDKMMGKSIVERRHLMKKEQADEAQEEEELEELLADDMGEDEDEE